MFKKLKDFLLCRVDIPMWGYLFALLVIVLDIVVITTKIL